MSTIKASARASARDLARHLTNANDNDHVTVHEVRGFMSDDIHGAFTEMEAIAKGTQCVQHMFSLSINPPIGETLSTEDFTETADHIEKKMGLSDQPRVVVFHEKENRLHAHVVWSRINADSMKAINLPFFKNRLNKIARDMYIDRGWELPEGYVQHEKRDAHNYSLADYQQAKRLDEHPKVIKALLQRCWNRSDNRTSFEGSIKQHGFFLARGDRRGFVAVSMTGEILSLSRWLGVKTKALKAKLDDPASLSSVKAVTDKIETTRKARFEAFQAHLTQQKQERLKPLFEQRRDLIQKQRLDRQVLQAKQDERRKAETLHRQSRYRNGLLGIWDRLRGQHRSTKMQNEHETLQCQRRDMREWDDLKAKQLKSRHHVVSRIQDVKQDLQKQQRQINEYAAPKALSASTMSKLRGTERGRRELDLGR